MNDFTNIRYETVEEDRTLSALDLSPAEGKSDRDMRDGMDCNYPDCGCCFDSKCSDAPDAAPSNPVISDEMAKISDEELSRLVDHVGHGDGVDGPEVYSALRELQQRRATRVTDELVERVFQAVAPHVAGTDWREVRAAITATLSVKPQSDK